MIKRMVLISAFMLSLVAVTGAQILDSISLSREKTYTSLAEALQNPEKVFILNLKKQKLKEIPEGIFKLKNLQILILSKNKIKKVPPSIGDLVNLQKLDLSANKIEYLPSEIGNLINLSELILNRNNISMLPASFGNLFNLEYLDLWSNEIYQFPQEIKKLQKTLRLVDMRVIAMNIDDQERIRQMLPYTIIIFSKACNCK